MIKNKFKQFNTQAGLWFRLWMPAEGETIRMGRSVMLCAGVGLLVGLFAACFYTAIEFVKTFALESMTGYFPAQAVGEIIIFDHAHWFEYPVLDMICPGLSSIFAGFLRFLLPGVGAWLAAKFAFKLAPSASGHGTDTVIAAYHHSAANIPFAVAPVKIVTSSLVIGCGGSAGAEGPVTQIGAACSAFVGRLLRLSPYEKRVLLAAGMAAGVGAIFRAPMAGALFAAEVFYRGFDLEGEVLIPSMVASTFSYITFACFFGWEPAFATPGQSFSSPSILIAFAALAFLIAIGVRFNIVFYRQTEIFFRKLKISYSMKPLIGGLLCGLIGLFMPQILGAGYGMIQLMLTVNDSAWQTFGTHLPLFLFSLYIAKVIATAFTVGSGGSGGLLGPSLFCGATLGAATAGSFLILFPNSSINIADFAMVGMAAYLTAAVRTPLAGIIMVSEFTGNHELLLPAMWVCGGVFLLTPGWTLYKSQVRDRDSSPIHKIRHNNQTHALSSHGIKRMRKKRTLAKRRNTAK